MKQDSASVRRQLRKSVDATDSLLNERIAKKKKEGAKEWSPSERAKYQNKDMFAAPKNFKPKKK